MAIEYTYKVDAVRVVQQGALADVVKEVSFTVSGADGAAKFALSTSVQLADADPDNFTDFDSLTEAQLIEWADGASLLDGVKAHVALVVAREAERLAMTIKPLPWVPASAPEAPVA